VLPLCGRFTLTRRKEEIIKIYKDRVESEIKDISKKIQESYNIAHSQDVAVITVPMLSLIITVGI